MGEEKFNDSLVNPSQVEEGKGELLRSEVDFASEE